jgi:hypothetical protein
VGRGLRQRRLARGDLDAVPVAEREARRQADRGQLRETGIDGQRGEVAAELRGMKAVGAVQLQAGVSPPGRQPGLSRREQDGVDILRGQAVGLAHLREDAAPAALGPDHVEGRAGTGEPDRGVEASRPLAQVGATLLQRRGALLQDHEAPAARRQALASAQAPMVLEGRAAAREGLDHEHAPALPREGLHHQGQVVARGEAVADEQHALAVRRASGGRLRLRGRRAAGPASERHEQGQAREALARRRAPRGRPHSWRSASAGSTPAARRAGP